MHALKLKKTFSWSTNFQVQHSRDCLFSKCSLILKTHKTSFCKLFIFLISHSTTFIFCVLLQTFVCQHKFFSLKNVFIKTSFVFFFTILQYCLFLTIVCIASQKIYLINFFCFRWWIINLETIFLKLFFVFFQNPLISAVFAIINQGKRIFITRLLLSKSIIGCWAN